MPEHRPHDARDAGRRDAARRGEDGSYGSYGDTVPHARSNPGSIAVLFCIGVVVIFTLFASGILLYSEKRLIGLLVAFFAYVTTLHNLRLGLMLTMFVIGLSPEMGVAGMESLRLEDFLFPGILLAWLCRNILHGHRFEPTPLKVPILLFLLLQPISMMHGFIYWADYRPYGVTSVQDAVLTVVKVTQYYLLFFLVLNAMDRRFHVRQMVHAFVAAGTLSALLLATGIGGVTRTAQAGSRLSGPEGEGANILGGYLIIHILVTAMLAFHVPRGRGRFILGGCTALQGYVLLETLSRGALAALIGGLIAIGIMRQRAVIAAVVVLMVLLPIYLPEDMAERFATTLDIFPGMSERSPPSSWLAKVHAWQNLLKRAESAPFFGRGAGRLPRSFVDSEYVKVIGEMGAIGFAVFVWMLVRIYRLISDAHARERDPVLRGFLLGFLGAYIALLIHAAAATSLTTVRTMEPLMFGLGLAAYLYNHPPAPAHRHAKSCHEGSREDEHAVAAPAGA